MSASLFVVCLLSFFHIYVRAINSFRDGYIGAGGRPWKERHIVFWACRDWPLLTATIATVPEMLHALPVLWLSLYILALLAWNWFGHQLFLEKGYGSRFVKPERKVTLLQRVVFQLTPGVAMGSAVLFLRVYWDLVPPQVI